MSRPKVDEIAVRAEKINENAHTIMHRDKFANVQWRENSKQPPSYSDRQYKSNPAAVDDSLGLHDPLQDLERDLKNSIGGHLKLDNLNLPLNNSASKSLGSLSNRSNRSSKIHAYNQSSDRAKNQPTNSNPSTSPMVSHPQFINNPQN